MQLAPALAVLVAALALYVSGGVLDQVETPRGLVRVALLPPWQALGAFVAVGGLGLLWLDRRAVPRGTATPVRPPLGPLLLPLFGLGLLVLPYLPWLPDIFPALQILAGPARWIIWLAIAAQLVWTLTQERLVRVGMPQWLTVGRAAVAIGAVAACISGAAALRLAGTVLYPAGDEPHYLVIAQSLWRDGDLKIENNHARGDYREYFPRDLDPHYLTRGADGEIYSIHPVGMPALIAPVYAAGGYWAVVLAFILMTAVAAGVIWHTTLRATGALTATTFAAAAVVATAPFLFNTFAVYPEIPAALAVAVAFALLTGPAPTLLHWAVVGVACAALPWLSTKYAPMSAAIVVVAAGRALLGAGVARVRLDTGSLARLAAIGVPYAVSLAAWFYFFHAIWGIPLPQAPYGSLVQTSPWNLVFGAPGLLFDQEYGVLPYAPVYILAATGLVAMWRHDAAARRQAVEVAIIFGALLGTVGAFRIWWGGSASPGRPVTSGLLLLALPMAFAFRAAAPGSARRAGHHLLLWASIGIAGVLMFAQQGLLTANGRDGTSTLLEYLSSRWPAWTLVPTFIHHEAPTALLHAALWLVLGLIAALVLNRGGRLRPGTASLLTISTTAVALLVAAAVMPLLPFSPPWPALDVRARARLPVLDGYDTVARPVGIEYAPLQFRRPAELVSHASVMVEPELRRESQPIRVLHNGRFSLPAGEYRLEIDWSGARRGETIGLQVGRTGDPWQQWHVDAQPGQTWSTEFALPVDAGFVGVRGTPQLEGVIAQLRFTPITIVDVGQRPRGPAVIAASRSGPASVFYYDTNVSPETGGFWVWGERQTRVTISRAPTEEPLVLRVHSGPRTNRLHLSTFGWRRSVALEPTKAENIEVPVRGGSVVTLSLAADSAFVPRDTDPTSDDGRPLGVWVEVVQ